MSGNRKTIFMRREFTRTYMHVKPQEKMVHDCLRGHGSLQSLWKWYYNDYKAGFA
jgi:hypothetical protein